MIYIIILGLLIILIYLVNINEPFKINLTRPIKKKKVSLKGKTPIIKKINSIIPNNYKEKPHNKYYGYKHSNYNVNSKLNSLLHNKLNLHNNSYEEYSTEEPPELIVNENKSE